MFMAEQVAYVVLGALRGGGVDKRAEQRNREGGRGLLQYSQLIHDRPTVKLSHEIEVNILRTFQTAARRTRGRCVAVSCGTDL